MGLGSSTRNWLVVIIEGDLDCGLVAVWMFNKAKTAWSSQNLNVDS